MIWFWSILAGLLAAPLGFAAGTAVAWLWFGWRGATEREGRRGLLAGTIGGPIGVVVGFYLAFQSAWWLLDGGGGALRSVLIGCLFGLPAAIVVGGLAVILGIRLAERRGVTNYAGERAAFALYYLAIPAAVSTAIAGFVAGWWLSLP